MFLNYDIEMISESSAGKKDWSNDAEKPLNHRNTF